MKRFFLPIFVILCICATTVEAQQAFKQSRFIGSPPGGQACTNCNVPEDGVTHLRFHPSVYETENSNNYLNFTVQVRRLGGSVDNYLSSGAFTLTYDTNVFGLDIGSGSGPSGTKCVSTVGDAFPIGRATYRNPAFTDIRPNFVTIRVSHANRTDTNSPADFGFPSTDFTALGPEWIDYISMRCLIPSGQESNEAGFAFSGTGVIDYIVRQFPGGDDGSNSMERTQRSAFFYADNDLRGFRLDGKTWAEDYARSGDGKVVRLKFSKGVAAYASGAGSPLALTAANFAAQNLDGASTEIVSVKHMANEPYVKITLRNALSDGVINLVSTTTSVVRDEGGDDLADGNFVASLHYDSAAPRATAIAQNAGFSGGANESEWTITFSSAINPDTVTKDNLCVTEANGVCVAEGTTTTVATVPVISVETGDTAPTTLTMVINEAAGAKTGGMRSIEFRRNAVLGTDLRIVEDYQPALRDQIMLADTIGPKIEVLAVNADGTPQTGNLDPASGSYSVYFRVTADEDVLTLDDPSSYQLKTVTGTLTGGTLGNIIPARTPTITSISGMTPERAVRLEYTVPVSNSRATANGFTVARNGTSLQDGAAPTPNDPVRDDAGTDVIADGARIDNDANAVAARNTTKPQITVTSTSISPSNAGFNYTITFQVSATEPISTIGNANSYLLQHIVSSGAAIDFSSETAQVTGVGSDNMSATVTYNNVSINTNNYDDVRRTTGFTLHRSSVATALLDADGNTPERGQGSNGTGDIANGERIDNDAVAARDTTNPVITIGSATATPMPGNRYSVSFTVTADEDVDTLDVAGSYLLVRFHGSSSDRFANTEVINVQPAANSSNNDTRAVWLYTVPLSLAQVRATGGFGLYRSASATALLDNSGNLPDNAATPAAAIGASSEIGLGGAGNLGRAVRQTDGPPITAGGGGVTANAADGNKYTITFTVTNTQHGTKPIPSLATSSSYVILRQIIGGTLEDDSNILKITGFTGSETGGVANLEFEVTINNQSNTEQTGGFVLGRTADGLLDVNSNPPKSGSTDIMPRRPINVALIAGRDTTKPSITVEPGEASTSDGDDYTLSFTVTASEANVRGLASRSSYRLLVAVSDSAADIANPSLLTTRIEPVITGTGDTVRTITYNMVNVSAIQTDLSISDFPYGLMLGRNGSESLRDLSNNDPLQVDADGNRTNTEVGNNGLLQLGAVALLDRVPPQIAVIATSDATPTGTAHQYQMTFMTSATETVRNIGETSSYNLIRIATNDTRSLASGVATVAPMADGDNSTDGTLAGFTYTVTFTGNAATALLNARATKGFTLGLVSGTGQVNLKDLANNLPVKVGGSSIYAADGTTLLDSRRGTIAVVTGNTVAASAVAERDTAAPNLTVAAVAMATPGDDQPWLYSGSFTVTSADGESIKGIGEANSYQLLRIPLNNDGTPNNGGAVLLTTNVTFGVPTAVSVTGATIPFNVNLVNIATARSTYGFTLARRTITNGGLRDQSDNNATVISSQQNRLTSGNDAIVGRDITPPQIQIVAQTPTQTGDGLYGLAFNLSVANHSATNNVASINALSAYQLVTVFNNNTSTPTRTPIRVTNPRVSPSNANRSATIRYDVDFSSGLTRSQIREIRGFTLRRASNSNTLIDESGNQPVKVDGTTSITTGGFIGAVSSGRVADAAVALRDTDGPQITVTGGRATPTRANTRRYTGSFTLSSGSQITLGIGNMSSYKLMRVLTDGTREIFNPTNGTASLSTSSPDNGTAATIGFTATFGNSVSASTISGTQGFTLARGDNASSLVDYSSNNPVDSGNTSDELEAGNEEALDTRSTAEATIEKVRPDITVTATGMATPAAGNGNQYTVRFTVESDEHISDIGDVSSYRVMRITTPTATVIASGVSGERAAGALSGTTATLEYTVTYTSISDTQMTDGFTLGRAGTADDCNLCDDASNAPERDGGGHGTGTIEEDQRIDNSERAVALRDTIPPQITVGARIIQVDGIDQGSPGIYNRTLNFNPLFSVNRGEDEIRGLSGRDSYRILGQRSDRSYTAITASFEEVDTCRNTIIGPPHDTMIIPGCGNIEATLNISARDAADIERIVLGRASGALRDLSNNDPVVANDSETPARVVGTSGANILPLDLIGHSFTLDRTSPFINVTANALRRTANRMQGSFGLASADIIDAIGNVAASYVLLRVPTTGTEVVLSSATIGFVQGQRRNDRTATVNFEITESDAIGPSLEADWKYTLGRAANLTDIEGNVLQDHTRTTTIGTNGRIDSRATALVDIPTGDTTNPEITLTARDTDGTDDNVEAIPNSADALRYSGSFTVRANEAIPNIGNIAAYRVVRVPNVGARVGLTANTTITIVSSTVTTSSAVVGFVTTLADITEVQATAGFTLNPLSILTDIGNNPPLNNEFSGENQIARRDQTPPRLTVTAATGSQPTFAGPLTMTAAFRVQAVGGETIRGIDEAGSYDIWRYPIVSGSDAPGAGSLLTSGIGSAAIDAQGQLVTAAITFASLAAARGTYGFTLTRQANLRDLSSNDIVSTGTTIIQIGNRIDAAAGAIWQREDRTRPTITVAAGAAESSGNEPLVYTGSFQVRSSDVIRNINSAAAYQLLVQTVGEAFSPISGGISSISNLVGNATAGYTGATVNFSATISEAQLTATGDDAIAGFALANALTDARGLQDIAGNVPVLHLPGNRLSDAATAIAERETVQPVITVVAQGTDGAEAEPASDNPLVYTGSFRVTTPADDPVRNLDSRGAYRLLMQTVGGALSEISADLSITNIAGNLAAGSTAVTVSFSTTLTQTQLDATGNNAVNGFTLGDRRLAGLAGLRDISGNLPVTQGSLNRLDTSEASLAQRDRMAPSINIVGGTAVPDEIDPNTYRGTFTVSAPEGQPITGLGLSASYRLLRVYNDSGSIEAVQPTTLTPDNEAATAQVTIAFDVTLDDIATTEDTDGFTLGYLANLQNRSGITPDTGAEGRLDGDEEAIASRDTDDPRFTVRSRGQAVRDSDDATHITYSMTFDVEATEAVRSIGNMDSYLLLAMPGPSQIPEATLQVTGAQVIGTTATVMATVRVAKTDDTTTGFTLGRTTDTTALNLRDIAGNRPPVAAGRLDPDSAAIANLELRDQVECAAFYPNIGQTKLFFRVESRDDFNLPGLTLMQGGSGLSVTARNQIGTTDGNGVSILTATVSEITNSEPITASYVSAADGATAVTADCMESLTANRDGDSKIDIVDGNPFDGSDTSVNDDVASATLGNTPVKLTAFYSRSVLVRSLIRGEAFTYVEAGEKKQFTEGMAMTADEYFGITPNGNTKVFTFENAGLCSNMLAFAKDNNLNKVKLDEFCDIGSGEIDFVNEPIGSKRYIWVDVNSDGRLVASDYPDYTIAVLPEINFSGQQSYIYDKATTKTVVVSAYTGNVIRGGYTALVESASTMGGTIADETITLGTGLIASTNYNLTAGGKHPRAGETITRWLSGTPRTLWAPTMNTLVPQGGGHTDFDTAAAAVGTDNYIDVRVAADGENEPITEIHQVLLYDVSGPTVQRVTSMVANRPYYVIADLTTNISDIADQVMVAAQLMDGYEIVTEQTSSINQIRGSGHLIEEEDFAIIAIMVDDHSAAGTITVGWDNIGVAENILATYRVTPAVPANYGAADNDGDRIRNNVDSAPNDSTRLQVAVENVINPNSGYLHAHDAHDEQPLYVSDDGLIIAAGKGDDSFVDYSAANIALADTSSLSELMDDEASINTIATFGIRSVDYAYTQADPATNAMAIGGMAYAVFPIPAGTQDEALYISHYNSESDRWERFERGTNRDGFADTWYAVDRTRNQACPTDIQLYKNEHMAAGDADMGFTANLPKCVMLAMTDGGPYDGSSMERSGADGRINSLIGIGTQLNSVASSVGLACAAVYPNIGQTELFIELTNLGTNGSFEIEDSDGNPIDQGAVGTVTASPNPVLRVTLASEITSDQPISVKYTADNEEGTSVESNTLCEVSLSKNSDGDSRPDITDSSPFDVNVSTPNPQTSSSERADSPAELSDYYSRDAVIRSLLKGEAFKEFTYVEAISGEVVEGTFTEAMAMNWDEYFGIEADATTEIFRIEAGSECEEILEAAKAQNLTKVKIDAFCNESNRVTDFSNEAITANGPQRYIWADVRAGLLVASDYQDHDLEIVPEINFSGQPSYIFAEPTTRTVTISSYIGDGSGVATVSVRALSRDGDYMETTDETLNDVSQPGIISRVYDITSHGEHPEEGETITRWLAGGNDIWSPTSTTLTVQTDGHDLSGTEYAVGVYNNINVRVADPADPAEEITRIRQILLYEKDGQSIGKVTSMVADRTYYVVADYDTNNEAIDIAVNISLMDNYVITTTTEAVMSRVEARRADDLKGEHVDIIELKVNDDITTTTLITAGWQRIGRVEDIRATYLVAMVAPSTYRASDIDSDRIPDDLVGESQADRLPVYIGGRTNDNHILTTHDGELPLFFTHTGLAIADDKNQDGVMGMHYSAANIKYDEISDDTKLLLGLRGSGNEDIYSITTFGVSDVEYGFVLDEGTEGATAELTGGTIYVVFPIAIADMELIDNPMYLGKYNSRDEFPSWKRFERGTETGFVDTWYAIERTDTAMKCPTDIQIYRNEHEAVGEENMGFTAKAHNCIMLVVTDGSPYDESSLDGRVIDPMSLDRALPAQGRGATGRGGGTGGGAIGISDVLLLIGSLVLLIIATSRRRRKQTA